MRVVKLRDLDSTNKYNINDTELSLGLTRACKVHAIYNYGDEASQNQADADLVFPNITYGSGTPAFTAGEIVVGRSSGAKGRVIKQQNSTTNKRRRPDE